MSHLRIAIAGCGPAGLAAALLLDRQGHDVTLFERFDAPRPIGSGLMLQPSGLAVLDTLGLAPQIIAHSAPIRALHGVSHHGDIALDARYADLGVEGACGLGIHRGSLFAILYRAVQAAGIAIETGFPVERSDLTENGRTLVSTAGLTTMAFDIVVDALGTATSLAPPCGDWLAFGALWATLRWPTDSPFDPGLLEQRYRHAHQMAGVLPTGQRVDGEHRELAFFWSLKADDYPAWRAAGLAEWKEKVLALWPDCACLLDQITDAAQLTFARYAHRQVPAPVQPRLIHIGDAWHSASPQLGQGANMALLDAYGLAKGLESDGPLQDRLTKAASLRSGHVKLYQALTWAATPLYQSERLWHAALRDLLLTPVGRIPPAPRIQSRLVSGLVGNPLGRLGLAIADYPALLAPAPR